MNMKITIVLVVLQIITIMFITIISPTSVRAGDIRGWIDEPEPNEIYTGIATIRGWAISTAGIKRIEMYYDGEYRTDIPTGGSRKDVGAIFPDYPDSDKSGFSMAYGYSNDNGPHVVTIKVTDNDDDVKEISSAFTTTGFDSGFIPDPADINIGTISDFVINNGNSLTLEGVDFRGDKQDIRIDWLTPKQNFTITSVLPSDSGADPSLDGVYKLTRTTFWFEDGSIADTESDGFSASATMVINGANIMQDWIIEFDGQKMEEKYEYTLLEDRGYLVIATDGIDTEATVILQRGNKLVTLEYYYDDPEENMVEVDQWQRVAASTAEGATMQQLSQTQVPDQSTTSDTTSIPMTIRQVIRDIINRE